MLRLVFSQKDIKVSSFTINDVNKNIYINKESNVISIDDQYTLQEYDCFLNSLVTFVSSGNTWGANLNTGYTTIYDRDNVPIKTIDFIASSSRDIKNFTTEVFIYPRVYFNKDFKSFLYGKVSKSEFNIIETYDSNYGLNGIWKVITDELFISKNAKQIALFNFKNEVVWQHSFSALIESDEAFLYDKLISIENKVFFNVAGGVNGGLFCLDIHSGKVLKKYHSFSRPLFQDGKYIYTSQYENILCRIDSNTLEVEEWDVNDLIKKNGFDNIHDHRCAAQDGLFYFTQTLGDVKAKLGVLDFNQKELLFNYEFEPTNGGIGSIKVSGDRVFIHTQDNTLHIFEKE